MWKERHEIWSGQIFYLIYLVFTLFIHKSIRHICQEKIWLLERMFLECVKIDTLRLYRLFADLGQAPVLRSYKSQLCFTNKFILTFFFIRSSYLLNASLTIQQLINTFFGKLLTSWTKIFTLTVIVLKGIECRTKFLNGQVMCRIQ